MSERDPIDWDELDAETQHELVSLAEKLGEVSEQSGGRTASRREFLGAITAAGLGGSLLSQGADRAFEDFVNPARAGTQSVAQFGEAGEPFDFVAEDIYGPGGQGSDDSVNFEAITTNTINKDTDILLIGPSGGLIQQFDPTNKSTPIQDAWDAMPGEGGTIIYPPRTIETPGNLSGAGEIRHIGHGQGFGDGSTQIKDTDSSTPTYNPTSTESNVFFDGIVFTGSGGSGRTAPGFHFEADCESWNLGPGMEFNFYGGADLFHFDSGAAWASVWDGVRAERYDRFLKIDRTNAPLNLNAPYLGSSDSTTPEIEINTNYHFRLGGMWNKGSTACPVVDASGAVNTGSTIHIGEGNYEPSNDAEISFIHKIAGQASVDVGEMDIHGNYTTASDYATVLVDNAKNRGAKTISEIQRDFPQVAITTDVKSKGAVIFDGPSAEVDNRTGATLSGSVNCLADGVFKKSTSNGNDGGTNDIVYGPG